jgi:hypothetical protein
MPPFAKLPGLHTSRHGLQGGFGEGRPFRSRGKRSATKNSLPRYGWDREGTSPCHPRRLIRSRALGAVIHSAPIIFTAPAGRHPRARFRRFHWAKTPSHEAIETALRAW